MAKVGGPLAPATFWVAAGVIIWTFGLYPLTLFLRARLLRRPLVAEGCTPTVTIIVAAHNEEQVIGAKLENLRRLTYPRELHEVIIASDGSDDATNAIVEQAGDRVLLLRLPRSGKAKALEAAVSQARGEVLVFTDADSFVLPDALHALVSPFADPAVGGVAGNQRYRAVDGDDSNGERGYWAVEMLLKGLGSTAGNAIAASGSLFAIRRRFFRPIPSGVNDDYFLSAGVVHQGSRLVYEPRAVVEVQPAGSLRDEFNRKVRVMSRAFRTELYLKGLLDPRVHGFYSVQILTQKILRRAAPVPLVALALSSLAASRRGLVYRLAASLQVVLYGAGIVGWLTHERLDGRLRRALALPAYVLMVNVAGAVALWNLIRGRRIDRWTKQRSRIL